MLKKLFIVSVLIEKVSFDSSFMNFNFFIIMEKNFYFSDGGFYQNLILEILPESLLTFFIFIV